MLPDNPLDRPDPSEPGIRLPSQGESVVQGVEKQAVATLEKEPDQPNVNVDYLQV